MQLYLLRHGQSESNARWAENPEERFHIPDPFLTRIGRLQANAAGRALARSRSAGQKPPRDPANRNGFDITHVYSSLMARAAETAVRATAQLDLPIIGRTDLHEWGGIYEWDIDKDERRGLPGRDLQFFKDKFPKIVLPEDFNPSGWWSRPYEARTDVPTRAQKVLDDLIARHGETEDRVLVVSHGGFLNYLIGKFVRLPTEQAHTNINENLWFVLNNTGITRIEVTPEFRGIIYHNRIQHLSDRLITN